MVDPGLPLTNHEYDEWGDPRADFEQVRGAGGRQRRAVCVLPAACHSDGPSPSDGSHRRTLQVRAVCPYQNVQPAVYPAMLVSCSQADARVPAWGPAKYVARVRAAQSGRGRVLLCPDEHEGHFVHERQRYSWKALQYAFLIEEMQAGA
jgi:oligopeptidase B